MTKVDELRNLMKGTSSASTMADVLGVNISWVIKQLHRDARILEKRLICCSRRKCENVSNEKSGVLMYNGNWYCQTCYKKWRHINHSYVNYYTKPNYCVICKHEHIGGMITKTGNRVCGDCYAKANNAVTFAKERLYQDLTHGKIISNMERFKAATQVAAKTIDKITLEVDGKPINIQKPFTLAQTPEDWDLIQYKDHQAFLRFDGVIVYLFNGFWYIKTTNELMKVNKSFKTPAEAIGAADINIPKGKLL